MRSETKDRLAVYTLAASILLSSVLFSMSQGNAHSKDTKQLQRVTACLNFALMDLREAIRSVSRGSTPFIKDISCF
jgi:hypothetical protein